jgi:CcmD family protein
MKNKFTALVLLSFLLMSSSSELVAQNDVEMAELFIQNGKIYVVVAVMSIVFTGIFLFLIRLDRKISRLEKDFEK